MVGGGKVVVCVVVALASARPQASQFGHSLSTWSYALSHESGLPSKATCADHCTRSLQLAERFLTTHGVSQAVAPRSLHVHASPVASG